MNKPSAVVTGAGQGIGRGIAFAFAKAGYDVIAADINLKNATTVAQEIIGLGCRGIGVRCDVSKKSDVQKTMRLCQKKFGALNVLVNNAGIFPFKSFMTMTEADWDKVIDVNLKSVFLCSQEAAKIMPDGGRIINISSIAAFVGFEGLGHYCASKGGITGLTRVLALELAPKKITVNAVAPGAIETPGASKILDSKRIQQTIGMIPLARMGHPDDIAQAVAFFASDGASYITGQTIIVDGGWTLR